MRTISASECLTQGTETIILRYRRRAVYADTEEECEQILSEMKEKYESYDPDGAVYDWYLAEAARAYEIELKQSGRSN